MANPSLAMIPSGYKAGKLYSVLPQDGTGDFTVSRNSVATRVNENGVIEEVAANVPRLDYSDGGCPVLLCEPQSTNLVLWSEDFSQSYWLTDSNRGDIISNVILAPDGTITADKLVKNIETRAYRYRVFSFNNVQTTFSVYVKGDTNSPNIILVKLSDNIQVVYSINEDSFTYVDTGVINYRATKLKNGWVKIQLTGIANETSIAILKIVNSNNIDICTDYEIGEGVYIWGAQIEQSSTSTSYIKTEGTTVTRLADVVTDAGDVNTFNSEEGTIFFESKSIFNGEKFRDISLSDGTAYGASTNSIELAYSSIVDKFLVKVYVNGNTVVNSLYNVNQLIYNKIAFKWDGFNCSFYINGLNLDNYSGVSFPLNCFTKLNLCLGNDVSNKFEGKVKKLQIYKKALSDTECIQLTS